MRPRKKFDPRKDPRKTNWTDSKKFDPWKNIFDPRNPRKSYDPRKKYFESRNPSNPSEKLTPVTHATHAPT